MYKKCDNEHNLTLVKSKSFKAIIKFYLAKLNPWYSKLFCFSDVISTQSINALLLFVRVNTYYYTIVSVRNHLLTMVKTEVKQYPINKS